MILNALLKSILVVVSFLFLLTACVTTPQSQSKIASSSITKQAGDTGMPDINEQPTESNFVSSIYQDVFLSQSQNIGKVSYEDLMGMLSEMNYIVTEMPAASKQEINLRVSDMNMPDMYVSLCFYPDNQRKWTLAFISYGNTKYNVSISDELHSVKLSYFTYAINREPGALAVNSVRDLHNFVIDDIPILVSAYQNSIEGLEKLNVDLSVEPVVASDGKMSFNINTNLPNDMELIVTLTGDFVEKPYYEWHTLICDGKTELEVGEPIKGECKLKISMPLPQYQSESVRNIIGMYGEFLSGKFVATSQIDECNIIDAEYTFKF